MGNGQRVRALACFTAGMHACMMVKVCGSFHTSRRPSGNSLYWSTACTAALIMASRLSNKLCCRQGSEHSSQLPNADSRSI